MANTTPLSSDTLQWKFLFHLIGTVFLFKLVCTKENNYGSRFVWALAPYIPSSFEIVPRIDNGANLKLLCNPPQDNNNNNNNNAQCIRDLRNSIQREFRGCWRGGFSTVRGKHALNFLRQSRLTVLLTRADSNGGGGAASRGPRALGAKSIQKCLILWSWDKTRGERARGVGGNPGDRRSDPIRQRVYSP